MPGHLTPLSYALRVASDLCGSLDLGEGLALLESSLLLESHNLESVEVGQGLSSLRLLLSLGPVALLPLRVDTRLLPRSLDSSCSGSPRQIRNDEGCQQDVLQAYGLPGNDELGVRRRSINQSALVVNYLDDCGKAAGVGAVALDEDDAADLDQAPGWRLDGCVAHFENVWLEVPGWMSFVMWFFTQFFFPYLEVPDRSEERRVGKECRN